MPAKPVAVSGAPTTHGGVAPLGSLDTYSGGQMMLRKNDLVTCPIHGPGKIGAHSVTVFVNNVPLARMGDHCICADGAKAGMGTGPTVGEQLIMLIKLLAEHQRTGKPLPKTRVTSDPQGRMPSEIAKDNAGMGTGEEFGIELEDVNKDGVVDTVRAEGALERAHWEGTYVGDDYAVRGSVDFTAYGVDGSMSRNLLGTSGNIQGSVLKLTGSLEFQEVANPSNWAGLDFELGFLTGSAGGTAQLSDGVRHGLMAGGGAEGSILSASVTGRASQSYSSAIASRVPVLGPAAMGLLSWGSKRSNLLAKGKRWLDGQSVESKVKLGAGAGSAGVKIDVKAAYDTELDRFELGAEGVLAELIKVGIDLGMSFGKGRKLIDLAPPAPSPGAAQLTVGSPTVLNGK